MYLNLINYKTPRNARFCIKLFSAVILRN